MKTVMTIFGTRPEAVKMAPVIKQLQAFPDHFRSVVVVTAQHREMLDQVLNLFEITPDYDLNIMSQNQTLFDVTTRALRGLQTVLAEVGPDIVLVQGDTTTSFVGALAAYYARLPVGHIEAGLRTFDKYQPFPEEINRSLISVIADLHFAPTEYAQGNLRQAGIAAAKIHVTGNTVIDALLSQVRPDYVFEHPVLSQLDFSKRKVILVTAHRRENFGQPMRDICRAVLNIVEAAPQVDVVFTVHHNPNARGEVEAALRGVERIHLLEPLDYLPFVQLMSRSTLILTDSGGVQEEAPSLGVPVLVLRNVTERGEGVTAGTLRLVGTDSERITAAALQLLNDPAEYQHMAQTANPYGNGQASRYIIEALADFLFDDRSAVLTVSPQAEPVEANL